MDAASESALIPPSPSLSSAAGESGVSEELVYSVQSRLGLQWGLVGRCQGPVGSKESERVDGDKKTRAVSWCGFESAFFAL